MQICIKYKATWPLFSKFHAGSCVSVSNFVFRLAKTQWNIYGLDQIKLIIFTSMSLQLQFCEFILFDIHSNEMAGRDLQVAC